jgi:hypothetical protein
MSSASCLLGRVFRYWDIEELGQQKTLAARLAERGLRVDRDFSGVDAPGKYDLDEGLHGTDVIRRSPGGQLDETRSRVSGSVVSVTPHPASGSPTRDHLRR